MPVDNADGDQLIDYPPACIIATVCHRGEPAVTGSVALEPHPANPNLLWCTKNQHWVHHNQFGGK
jgi:hypothetical protein